MNDASARLSIVIVTYKQHSALNCLLASLDCQTSQVFDVLVLHDGPDALSRSVVEQYSGGREGRWKYFESETRFNDYGHSLREMGIRMASNDYLLITNGDNYYSPRLVEYIFSAVDAEPLDVVMWDLVHSHNDPGGNGNPSYSAFSTYPMYRRADIGAFCVKSELAKLVGFRDRTHDADWTYMYDILEKTDRPVRIGKIRKVLMIHN